jgi:hypothetical protein
MGLDTEQVMVVFKETAWENWSFGGGRFTTPEARLNPGVRATPGILRRQSTLAPADPAAHGGR